MTRVNPNNENETKSEIFAWDIFKSYTMYIFLSKDMDINRFLIKKTKFYQS